MTRQPQRRRAGAALTEALFVSATLMVLLAAVFYVYDLHARKGDTLRQARYQAWAATRPGCTQFQGIVGQESRDVALPLPLRGSGSLPVKSALELECNVEPHPEGDILSALDSITDVFDF